MLLREIQWKKVMRKPLHESTIYQDWDSVPSIEATAICDIKEEPFKEAMAKTDVK